MGWVCPECGLDYDTIAPGDIPVALRSYPRRYREAMELHDGESDAALRARREPDVWSALEYSAHVDDIFADFTEMFDSWVRTGRPSTQGFDPDERAAEQRYNERDPKAVLESLATHANELADVLDRVKPDEWTRTAEFSFGERDVLAMARNAVHEGKHHLRDIEKVLGQIRAAL